MASSLAGPRISPCAIVALQGGLIVMSPTVGKALRTINLTTAVTVSWAIAAFALSSVPRAQVVTDDLAMNAAHRLGTQVTVCRDACVIVRINDRRPLVRGTDLTPTAARAIGLKGGVAGSHHQ
jgi:hypothetical protein